MAASRLFAQSRFALSRGLTAPRASSFILRIASNTVQRQQFSSSGRVQEQVAQTSATGAEVPIATPRSAPAGSNARSIFISKLGPDAVPADIDTLLQNAGLDVQRMQFGIDRFTFRNDKYVFVELASEEQVQKAIQALNGQQVGNATIAVLPLSHDFTWLTGFKKERKTFFYDAETPSQAIQGLLDGRRYRLYVDRPGWDANNIQKREIIHEHLGPFQVETIGTLSKLQVAGDRNDPTFLTFIEFGSKDGAEQAVQALNGQAVNGAKVYLKPQTLTPKLVQRIERIDKSLVARLLQQGILFEKENQTKAQT